MSYLIKKTGLIIFILTSIAVLILISCESEDVLDVQSFRKSQLKNIYDNEITNLNTQFVTETNSLSEVIKKFKEQTNPQNLELIQLQWIQVLKVCKQLELYNLGQVAKSFVYSDISRWPSNVDFINNYIEENVEINELFVQSKGSSSKGISAIEYLIFSENNEVVLNGFTEGLDFENRLDYLVSLAINLKKDAKEFEALWKEYSLDFISSLHDGTSGGQNQIVNAMVSVLERVIISRLEKPLGENIESININKLEAFRSGTSLLIIKQNLISLERCYTGSFDNKASKFGFYDYLEQVGRNDLNIRISEAFSQCDKSISSIQNTLKIEIENNRVGVVDLKNDFRELLLLIKIDMASVLGSTITFNDNDGD